MAIVESILEYSLKPCNIALETVKNHKSSSCLDSITARLLFAANLIISAIALPIILIVGLISTIVDASQGEGLRSLVETICTLLITIKTLPISIIGIIAPLSATEYIEKRLDCCSEDNQDVDNEYERELTDIERLDLQEFRELDSLQG